MTAYYGAGAAEGSCVSLSGLDSCNEGKCALNSYVRTLAYYRRRMLCQSGGLAESGLDETSFFWLQARSLIARNLFGGLESSHSVPSHQRHRGI